MTINSVNINTKNETSSHSIQKSSLHPADVKIYSLTRRVFEGLALILANIVTFGLINIFKCVREEYQPVFGRLPVDILHSDQTKAIYTTRGSTVGLQHRLNEESELNKHLQTILPCSVSDNPVLVEKFPKEIRTSMDALFGVKHVVSKMPTCQKVVDDSFDIKVDVPLPIMKAIDKNGNPMVFIRLKIGVSGEEYYQKNDLDKHHDYAIARDVFKKISEKRQKKPGVTTEQAFNKLMNRLYKRLEEKTFTIILRRYTANTNPLMWVHNGGDQGSYGPNLLHSNWNYQITDSDKGQLIRGEYDPLPEFQKLVRKDGMATDPNGNKWKLATCTGRD